MSAYLDKGLPQPVPAPDGLDEPYWRGLREEQLCLQRCGSCGGWQWGPEWTCHRCLSFELGFEAVEPTGVIYSYERVWHPVHPALVEQGPYVVVLVELPQADKLRLVGNSLGELVAPVEIGAEVRSVYEHHADAEPAFTLLQWARVD